MDMVELHRRAWAEVEPVVRRVRPVDLGLPTPCTGWDLRALLEHMAGQDHGFAAAVRAGEAEVDAGAFTPRPLGADPGETCAAAAADLDAAFAAADPGATVWLPEFGSRLPLEQVIGFHLVDVLVHGWDVAAALGIALDPAEDLVTPALELAVQVPDGPFREQPGAVFGPALPHGGTDPWARTLALLGRDPMWAPPV